MKKHLLVFILFSNLFFANGQSPNEYSIQWFNTENGLPANGIKGLQWDHSTQFLWVATEAGIVRYNGVDLLTFTQKNTPAVTSERINFMVKNQLNEIYVADYNGNAIKIDGARPLAYHTVSVKSNENDHCLYGLQVSTSFFKKKLLDPINEPIYLPFDQLANIDTLRTIILHDKKLWLSESNSRIISPINTNGIKIETIFKLENEIYLLTKERQILPLNSHLQIGKPLRITWDQSILGTQLPTEGYLLWETGSHAPIYIAGEKAWELRNENGVITNKLITSNLPQEGFIKYIQHIEEFDMVVIGTDSKGIAVLKKKRITPVKLKNIPTQQRTAYYNQLELSDGSILTNQGHILAKDKKKPQLPPY